MKRHGLAVLILAVLAPSCGSGGSDGTPPVLPLAVGLLDAAFGGGIKLTANVPGGGSGDEALAVALMADGRLVIVGYTTNGSDDNYAIYRHKPDGSLDPTFNGSGVVVTAHAGNERALAVAVQPDGRIIVVGSRAEAVARYNVDGSLDASFDGDGFAALTGFSIAGTPRSIALQPDGKIVIVGSSYNGLNYDFAVVRLNPDGSPDTSFDGDGYVQVPMSPSSDDYARAVAIQTDGKIVVAGRTQTGGVDFAVMRLNSNGSLDTSFDGDGKLTTAVGASVDDLYTMALQPDGKIVVAGVAYNTNYDVAVVRYNTDGSLDTTFDGDGKVTYDFTADTESIYDMAVQPDGGIVLVGSTHNAYLNDALILRLLPTGALDPAFGAGGKRIVKLSVVADVFTSVLIQPDGKIVAVGSSPGGSLVMRFNPDGSTDTGFSADGRVTVAGGSSSTTVEAVARQPDGKFVVAGIAGNGGLGQILVARFTASGAPDPAFGTDSVVMTPAGTNGANGFAVAIQDDGRIVVAGCANNGSDNDFLVVRYLANGALDTSFNGTGIVITPFAAGSDEQARAVAILPGGKILVAGYAYQGVNSDFAVVRYNGDGSLDTSFDGDGKLTTDLGFGWDRGYAMVVYPDGRFLVAGVGEDGTGTDAFAAVRYLPDGALDTSFNGTGIVRVSIGSDLNDDAAYAVALAPDGKIVLAGQTNTLGGRDTAVVRLNPDGSLDTTFSGDGIYTTNLGASLESALGVAVQADGGVLVTGDLTATKDFAMLRLTNAGVPDPGFGVAGLVTTDFNGRDDTARAILVLADGAIVLAGTADYPECAAIAVYR